MQLFYTTDVRGQLAYLPEEEARHCIQVLRHKVGDRLQWVDGKGHWYEGEIIEAGRKNCVLSIQKQIDAYAERSFRLHIAIAPTKHMDRLEWFLEKATEIGVDEVSLLLCDHSERRKLRLDRLERVLRSAMKQSLRAWLPRLNGPIAFNDFIVQQDRGFIAHCQQDDLPLLKTHISVGEDVLVCIGPEGDFSEEEIEKALARGLKAVSLGKSRLRTETAGIVACHTANLMNE